MGEFTKNKKRILDLLEKHPETDTFEISMLLNISPQDVSEVLENLEESGQIEVIKN